MKYLFVLVAFALVAGCSKQQKTEDQAGTASRSTYSEVIDSNQGYIIENASLAEANQIATFTIANQFQLVEGTTSVLIIRSNANDKGAETLLALQFPSFAEGTTSEFGGDSKIAQFWVIASSEKGKTARNSGLISGSLRFIKKAPSSITLGLNREMTDGIGDIEIVVANIEAPGLNIPVEKKYAARFKLPIISLKELVSLNQPA